MTYSLVLLRIEEDYLQRLTAGYYILRGTVRGEDGCILTRNGKQELAVYVTAATPEEVKHRLEHVLKIHLAPDYLQDIAAVLEELCFRNM